MIINIFGSTGIIGRTTLTIIEKKYSNYKINLLCAKNNYKLLAKQSRKYNVKYLYLDNHKFNDLKKVSFEEAINHPKWKMGYKNSIDSATLVNKCLELIEAHYLFNIPINKLDILIHPQSLVHSIIEGNNYVSKMNYFHNDMKIPLMNFLNNSANPKLPSYKKFNLLKELNLNFFQVSKEIFPLYFYFKSIDKTNPCNLIKFNVGNEHAVDLFKQKKINYPEIMQIIKEITSLNFNSDVSTVDKIIIYHEQLKEYIEKNY